LQTKVPIKLIQSSKFIILENVRLIFLFILISIKIVYSQSQLPVNDSVQNFLFAKSKFNNPILITVNGVYEYKSKWEYSPLIDDSFKKQIKEIDELNHANFFTKIVRNNLYIISNGAGPVFKKSGNNFIRIDNSTLHKNQFGGARFVYNDKVHIYGGYGFWSFKNFITFYDENIKQWDIFYNNSKYLPPGRWKPIYNLLDDKLYVFGGRSGSAGTINQDESFSDIFYFDLINKEFISLGYINKKLKTKYSLFSQPKLDDNIFLIDNDNLTRINFNSLKATNYYQKNFFLGIDNKFPTFIKGQKLFYISNVNGIKYLNFFDLKSIDKSFEPETFSLLAEDKQISLEKYLLFGVLIFFVFWVILKIFSFKDFIKGLILYDENSVYFNNESVSITSNEQSLISYLSENPFITAPQVNRIISDQQFAKSHFTSLRNKLVGDLNEKLFILTKNEKCIIETKLPKDNRLKAYKADSSIIKKKISFFTFLFRN
tara:strand:+ start:560 stop:2017 length:1458 start_codon:yes stop_codon:yes gene_type:complete